MNSFKKIWGILLFIISPYLLSYTPSEKEIIFGLNSDEKQKVIESIRIIRDLELKHLVSSVSNVLNKSSSDKDVLIEVINLYESYGDSLAYYNPNALEDYEWIVNNLREDDLTYELIESLMKRKDKRLIYPIISLTTHRSHKIRQIAFLYLESFKDDRVLPYILELGNSDNPLHRYYYLESLNYINDERANLHVTRLLNDSSAAIRFEAIKIIERLQIREKDNIILNLTKSDSNYEVRKISMLYAKNKMLRSRSNVFKDGLEDPNIEVREVALESIKFFKDNSYAKSVSSFLENERDTFLKLKAIETLVSLNSDGGGNGLVSILFNDNNSDVRKKSAFALGTISNTKTLAETLNKSLLRENDIGVKEEIIKSIRKKKDKSSVSVLIKKLKDPTENTTIKLEVIKALDSINDPSTLPEIFDLIDSQLEISIELKSYMRLMLNRFHGNKSK
jgi:HEAT repeat protein